MKNKGLWIGAGLLLLLLGILVVMNQSSTEMVTNTDIDSSLQAAPVLSKTTLPLQVSGIVEASDHTIVAAKTAGVLKQLLAHEGSRVNKGALLAVQDTPVADAEVYAAGSERTLTSLNQSLAVEQASVSLSQAEAVAYSARELATLNAAANEEALTSATRKLLSITEQNLSILTNALNFIDDHKALFDGQDLEVYRQLVANLYGAIPKQFSTAVTAPVENVSDLRAELSVLKQTEQPEVVAVQNIASLTVTQLSLLTTLFNEAETEIYDQRQIDPAGSSYIAYFDNRNAILAAVTAQVAAVQSLQQVVDATLADATTQTRAVTVSDLDTDAAMIQARYSDAIKVAAIELATARRSVAVASQSLGKAAAPFAGSVAEVFVREGEYLMPGTPILSLVGIGGREITVSIPATFAANLMPGTIFTIDGVEAGVLDRIGAPTVGGSLIGVIRLTSDRYHVGDSLQGTLLLDAVPDIYAVPRSALYFDSYGPYITYQDDSISRVRVVYDLGSEVFVTVDDYKSDALKPASVFNLAV